MSRLSEHLSPLEQAAVCNAFQRRLMITDAIFKANEILKNKGDKLQIHRDGMEVFLQSSAPHLWQAFKLKRGPPSIEMRMRNSKRYIEGLLGKKPVEKMKPHPPFPIFGDDEEGKKRRTYDTPRGEVLDWGPHTPDSYRVPNSDSAFLRELLPDYEVHQKRDAELGRKKRLEDSKE